MDVVVKKIAALGIPGVVILIATATTGYSGAAALTAALAALGPFGMIGGLFTLGAIGLISHAISGYGVRAIIQAVVKEQVKTKTKQEIISEIEKYPVSKDLKLRIFNYLDSLEV
ncbi:hypothetical protein [Bifidobacterium crudilactis]|jgi:hypothetical protein|uniref:hypothetical protein n=1 Tax=Bifidobacterium crudilactis TaxID=327277 RepID=UPI002354FA07|nr:hypothetical protein [Bifidobacterium crudilactis]MCI1868288.1 hypothetical protein [Bifidobacterium crudilactis]